MFERGEPLLGNSGFLNKFNDSCLHVFGLIQKL